MSLCGKGLKNRGNKRSKKRGRVAPRKRGITVRKASMVGIGLWKEEGHFRGMERQDGKRGWTGKRIEDEGEQEEKQTERNKTGTAPIDSSGPLHNFHSIKKCLSLLYCRSRGSIITMTKMYFLWCRWCRLSLPYATKNCDLASPTKRWDGGRFLSNVVSFVTLLPSHSFPPSLVNLFVFPFAMKKTFSPLSRW